MGRNNRAGRGRGSYKGSMPGELLDLSIFTNAEASTEKEAAQRTRRTHKQLPRDRFARLLRGFSPAFTDILWKNGYQRPNGFDLYGLPVEFEGPNNPVWREEIPIQQFGVVRTKSGLLVATGRVAIDKTGHIGGDDSKSTVRIDPPEMGGQFESGHRINIALPSEVQDASGVFEKLSAIAKSCGEVCLSPVLMIGGEKTAWADQYRTRVS